MSHTNKIIIMLHAPFFDAAAPADERVSFRSKYGPWDECPSSLSGAAEGIVRFLARHATAQAPRSSSCDRANGRIRREDAFVAWKAPLRGNVASTGPQFWQRDPPATAPAVAAEKPASMSKKQAEAIRRAKQADEDRARAAEQKAAAAAAAPKPAVAAAEKKKTKPKKTKPAAATKKASCDEEEERLLKEAIDAAQAERKLKTRCVFCEKEDGTLDCHVCKSFICQSCADLGALQQNSIWDMGFFRAANQHDRSMMISCGRCHWPEDGDLFPPITLARVDPIDRAHAFALRMEKATREHFFMTENKLVPSKDEGNVLMALRMTLSNAKVRRDRFVLFFQKQIEMLCRGSGAVLPTFEKDMVEFLAEEEGPERVRDGKEIIASDYVIVAFTEIHRRICAVRSLLNRFSKESRVGFRIPIIDICGLPHPLGIKFKLDLDMLEPVLVPLFIFCEKVGINVPGELSKRVTAPFARDLQKDEGMHPLETDIVSYVYSKVGRWHFSSIVNRAVTDIILGRDISMQDLKTWIKEEKERADFREGASRWEVHSILRKRLMPIMTARHRFNAIQSDPVVKMRCVPGVPGGSVRISFDEEDVAPHNMDAFRAVRGSIGVCDWK